MADSPSDSPGSAHSPRRLRALIVASLLPLTAFVGTVLAFDLPLQRWGTVRAPDGHAALAVRDEVHAVEKLGTWALVEPRLQRSYAEVRTVTQAGRGPGTVTAWSEFGTALRELSSEYERVDIFLLSHTNNFVETAERLDLPEGSIGLVYNSGCKCGAQAGEWTALGVEAYVAHPETASHAAFFVHFLEEWLRGADLTSAVEISNARADRFFEVLGLAWPGARAKWLRSHAAIAGRADLTLAEARP